MFFITCKQYMEYEKFNHILELNEPECLYQLEGPINKTKENNKTIIEINKKHDKMFRNILSMKKEMVKFINDFLNLRRKITEKQIIQCKTDFITKDYRNKQSDIIYKIKNKPIYFLIEHQSTIDKDMTLRIYNYVGEIMRRESILQKTYLNENNVYPIVVPIIIYTGYKKWNLQTNFIEYQYKDLNYEDYKINLKYNLISVADYSFEELFKKNSLLANIMIIEKCTLEEMEKYLSKIIDSVKSKEDIEILSEIISYIIQPILGKEKAEILLDKLIRKEENSMSPLVKSWLDLQIKYKTEGRKEGIKEGKKEGRREGKKIAIIDMAKKMIQNKINIRKIEEITGLSKEEIEKLVQN